MSSPARPRVLVRESIAESGLQVLRERFEVVEDFDSELEEIIGGFDAIVVRSATTIDASLIERATRLKVIGRAGVGVDNVDLATASKRGILVANAPQSTVVSAAEHTVGLLLALARSIPQAHAALKTGTWERSAFAGTELAGKTLGLVGFGRIEGWKARYRRPGSQTTRRPLVIESRADLFESADGAAEELEVRAERFAHDVAPLV